MCTPQYITSKTFATQQLNIRCQCLSRCKGFAVHIEQMSDRFIVKPARSSASGVDQPWTEQHVLPDIYRSKCVTAQIPQRYQPHSFARDSVIRITAAAPSVSGVPFAARYRPVFTIKTPDATCVISKRGITANIVVFGKRLFIRRIKAVITSSLSLLSDHA